MGAGVGRYWSLPFYVWLQETFPQTSSSCSYLPLCIAGCFAWLWPSLFSWRSSGRSCVGCCFVRFARWSNPTRTLSHELENSTGWHLWQQVLTGSKLKASPVTRCPPRSSANEPTPKEEKSKGPPQLGFKGLLGVGTLLVFFFYQPKLWEMNCTWSAFFYSTIVERNFLLRLWLPLSRQQKAQQVSMAGWVRWLGWSWGWPRSSYEKVA